MVGEAERDRKIKLEVLKWAYAKFIERPQGRHEASELLKMGFDEKDLRFIAQRLNRNGLIKLDQYGGVRMDIHILAPGIDALQDEGVPTILDDPTRYDILRVLYKVKRNAGGGWASISYDALAKELASIDPNVLLANSVYLEQADDIDLKHDRVNITDQGIDTFQEREEHGTEGVRDIRDMWQVTIGPKERATAEQLFREITELAKSSVIIVDAFAKEPTFAMLASIVPPVQTQILTSDAATNASYGVAVRAAQTLRPLEVRTLPKSKATWPFHSRYLIIDRSMGWVWDHSFYDAGETQHTISSMKPVNLKRTLDDFDKTWPTATVI